MTIAAISTAPGIGGIAVLRVSGPSAISIVDSLFQPMKAGHQLAARPAHTITFGQIVQDNGETLDEVVVSLYRAPHSFTGEDTVEISCHGSIYIQQALLQLLLTHGCRLAEPGEFTRRAFAHGRMDLSQAEAVADLIASENAAAHRLAMNQMKGNFSRKLGELRQQLVDLSALIELELDFSEEDVEFADRAKLRDLASHIHTIISQLADSFHTGNAIRNGIPITIIGETNAGKSTLLNLLLGDDKAIVSDVHGTTRDVVEDTCVVNGQLLRFIDTAGIRDTQDQVESLGIERTYQRLSQASIVLWMIDGTRLGDPQLTEDLIADATALHARIAPYLHPEQRLFILINKADLVSADALQAHLPQLQQALAGTYLVISAKAETGIDQLRQALKQATALPQMREGDVVVSNVRHYEALRQADAALLRVLDALNQGAKNEAQASDGTAATHHVSPYAPMISGEFIAEDLRECNHFLGTILGEVSTDELLGNIFSRFCIGK